MDNQLSNQNPPVQPLPAEPQPVTPSQPVSPPSTPPSNNSPVVIAPQNKTRKILLIIVAIFFLLLTIVAAYLMLWQKPASQPAATTSATPAPSTPTPNPTANSDSTPIQSGSIGANWQTYSNPGLGFSFLYPKELAYPYDQLGDLISKKSTQGTLVLQNYDGSKPPPFSNTLQIVIDITRSQTLTLDQYVKNSTDTAKLNGSTASGSAEKTTVAGYPALAFITAQKGEQITNVAFKYIDLIYNTSINSTEKEKVTLLNNILATFAFSASPSAKITP